MSRVRPLTAWMLLAAFVAGGLLGPVVHRVHHAAETASATATHDGSCHIDAAHTADAPVLASDANALHAPDCVLCATRLLVSAPVFAPTMAPFAVSLDHTVFVVTSAPSPFLDRAPIRGPPLLG